MFRSRLFTGWFFIALVVWAGLFVMTGAWKTLATTWIYPAVMVVGAFVAGVTPEGGGAVAFPVLSVVFEIDRVLARDFSLMIQSIGMTSASIFILTHPETDRRAFRPLLWMVPVACAAFALGMATLQAIPVYLIQALFLALIAAFAIAYVTTEHRGDAERLPGLSAQDIGLLVLILIAGGLCASLFGTGADIVLYTLLVSRFRLREKAATQMSIILMAAVSVFGFVWRGGVEQALVPSQFDAWLAAFPVVLFMAPFGVFILRKINVEWMLRGIVVLNIAQLAYFNLRNPSVEKMIASAVFFLILLFAFRLTLVRLSKRSKPAFEAESSA